MRRALTVAGLREGSRLISVDLPYMRLDGDVPVGSVVHDDLRDYWTLLKMPDRRGLPRAIRMAGSIDLAHYDSDKSIDGKRFAYPLLWSALRPGGIFIADDISDDTAFSKFCEDVNVNPVVVGYDNKYLGILVKDDEPVRC